MSNMRCMLSPFSKYIIFCGLSLGTLLLAKEVRIEPIDNEQLSQETIGLNKSPENQEIDKEIAQAVRALDNPELEDQYEDQDVQEIVSEDVFQFSYSDQDLVVVINKLAAIKGVNIVLPQGPDAIKGVKLSIHFEEEKSIDDAWNILQTILDVAGYSMVPMGNMTKIVKVTDKITRSPMPIYVGMSYEEIPSGDQWIRYLTYLSNMKVTEDETGEMATILKNLLPPNSVYKLDSTTNAVLIMSKADDVKQIMQIITELDQAGFQETLEIFTLRYTNAKTVADLFTNNILKQANDVNRYRLDARRQPSDASYFSQYVKIMPEERSNSLIILGRKQAVLRIKNFITKYIDVELESGKSILHVYELQYLDAQEFAIVLQNIVKSTRPGGAEQAIGAGNAPTTGIERFFDEIIVRSDKPSNPETQGYGGNNLIIAARNEDWQQIRRLIEELDQPRPQVLLEVLVADLTIDDNRLLGSISRNPAKIPLPNKINFQSGQLPPGIITEPVFPGASEKATLKADLLQTAFGSTNQSAAQLAPNGSTVISLNDNDGRTYSILEVLKLYGHTKVLSHPHVIATNNEQASIVLGQSRFIDGEAASTFGGSSIIKKERVDANLTVKITPRISTGDVVNIQVEIDVTDFVASSDTGNNSRVTRNVVTNANVTSESVLALGGLIRVTTDQNANETPILGKIPFLGNFFRRRRTDVRKTNLTVFIAPTIIQPRLRRGIGDYTRDYLGVVKQYANEGAIFDTLKEPITRWFFKTDTDASTIADNFLAKDEIHAAELHNNQFEAKDMKRKKKKKNKIYAFASWDKKESSPKDEHVVLPDIMQNKTIIAQDDSYLKNVFKNASNPFDKKDIEQLALKIDGNNTSNKGVAGMQNLFGIKQEITKIVDSNTQKDFKQLIKDEQNPFTRKNKDAAAVA